MDALIKDRIFQFSPVDTFRACTFVSKDWQQFLYEKAVLHWIGNVENIPPSDTITMQILDETTM